MKSINTNDISVMQKLFGPNFVEARSYLVEDFYKNDRSFRKWIENIEYRGDMMEKIKQVKGEAFVVMRFYGKETSWFRVVDETTHTKIAEHSKAMGKKMQEVWKSFIHELRGEVVATKVGII